MNDQQRNIRPFAYVKVDGGRGQAPSNGLLDVTSPSTKAAPPPATSGEPKCLTDPRQDLPGLSTEPTGGKIESLSFVERQVCAEAEAKGYNAGKKAAEELHGTEGRKNKELVASMRKELTAFRREQEIAVQSAIIALSLKIVEKIVLRQTETDPLFLAASVRYAIDHMQTSSKLILKVAMVDFADWISLFGKMDDGREMLMIVGDPELGSGMCRLENGSATADYSARAQLNEIMTKFEGMLSESVSNSRAVS